MTRLLHGEDEHARRARELRDLDRNRLWFRLLQDDRGRARLYRRLQRRGFPLVRIKSLLPHPRTPRWPTEDLYVLSKAGDIEAALHHGSVAPYAALDSGGRFMLGIDEPTRHIRQRCLAARAIHGVKSNEIEDCLREAWRLASILPLKRAEFDAALLAEQVALRFVELLFGLPLESHVRLERLTRGAYRRLTFQIIGRHFASDGGPAPDDPRVVEAREELDEELRSALDPKERESKRRHGMPSVPLLWWLVDQLRKDAEPQLGAGSPIDERVLRAADDEALTIVKGLAAGTVGNVQSAVVIALQHLFAIQTGGLRLVDDTSLIADPTRLEAIVTAALSDAPPAPFLTRLAPNGGLALEGHGKTIPAGAPLLLLMGADPRSAPLFGNFAKQPNPHACIGQGFALPLCQRIVREIARLPGVDEVLDEETGRPVGPTREWGVICRSYPLRYRRAQRLNQQPLFVVLPIKEPVRENAEKLRALTEGGACLVEDALNGARHVHFAWFNIIENGTCLAMTTTYDGDFDAYVEHFALNVDLFDRQFEYLDVDQPLPVREHPKQFVENIRKYNRAPLAGYFYSAHPLATVDRIDRGLPGDDPDTVSRSTRAAERSLREPPRSRPQPRASARTRATLSDNDIAQAQRLALRGYSFDKSLHFVLKVENAEAARRFLRTVIDEELLGVGGSASSARSGVDLGFTYRGLMALGLADRYLNALETRAPAFTAGAALRAAQRLGDAGSGAPANWDPIFQLDHAHVLLTIHGDDEQTLTTKAERLKKAAGPPHDSTDGAPAFSGWDRPIAASHLEQRGAGRFPARYEHFGFRDNVTRPTIVRGSPNESLYRDPLAAGELLTGHPNEEEFDRFGTETDTSPAVRRFFRNGSFCALRKIAQDVAGFRAFIEDQASMLWPAKIYSPEYAARLRDYLKAKMCGRWPDGALVRESHGFDQPRTTAADLAADFGYEEDPFGFGCPFGSHVRRMNPRERDALVHSRPRWLFRRGMPYGPRFQHANDGAERGLLGLFFCASLEDQFEHVLVEWAEKVPLGSRDEGRAKDPLIGHHDDPDAEFVIPRRGSSLVLRTPDLGAPIAVRGLRSFTTTRGMLYAFFPSRDALQELATGVPPPAPADQPSGGPA